MRAPEEHRTLQPRTFEVDLLCALRRLRLEVDRVAVEILALIDHEVNVLAAFRILLLLRRRRRRRRRARRQRLRPQQHENVRGVPLSVA